MLPESFVAFRGKSRTPAVPGCASRIALTFDDGPGELTRAYLEVLARFDARATFFVVGDLCARYPELVAEMAGAGHEVQGHGYTHRRFTTLSSGELRDELLRTAALLPATPGRRPLVRPPHGALSMTSAFTCARAGFTVALWSHDSGDWCTKRADEVAAAFDGARALPPGAVVLLHEGQEWTLEALPVLLSRLKEAGHELVSMGDLLGR